MEEGNLLPGTHGVSWLKKNPTITVEPHDKSTATVVPAPPVISSVTSSENFLKIILDLGYYAGVVPYHIKYDKTLRDFVIHRNRLQMVYSIFIRIVTLVCQINHILILQIDTVGQDPTLYFQLFRRVTFLITFTAWFKCSWSKSEELRIFAASTCKALPGNYHKLARTLITVCCLSYAFVGTIGAVFIVEGKTYWDPQVLINAYLNRTKVTFRLLNAPPGNQIMTTNGIHGRFDESIIVTQDATLIVIQFFMDFCHDANAWILYMFMISTAIVTWLHTKSFKDDIINSFSEKTGPTIVYHKYTLLKEMFNNVRSIYGLTLLVWICYIVPYTSLKISAVASDPDWFLVVFNLTYFLNTFIFLVLSADACAKIGYMSEWLIRDEVMMHFDCKKHNALLMELWNAPVAIRSYNGIFAITYHFIGNIFTLMTSFFIIITQFKMSNSDSLLPKV